jgi:hydantoinase/carbamoylase family amidase
MVRQAHHDSTAIIHERLAELAKLGAEADGINRPLFTAPEHAARARVAAWASAAGFALEQDRAGNLFARLAGETDGPPVQCGSHLDTVKGGGAYDGAYGVVGGLAALELIARRDQRPRRALEVVAWAGEEGSRFPLGTLGSSVYAGITPYDHVAALVADDGETFAEALRGRNGLLPNIPVREGFPAPHAYFELHIEQGPVLEAAGVRLGIVTAIAGQRRLLVTINGTAGHAGTIPMAQRADALCAASELVLAVEAAARAQVDTVGTVGRLTVEPNGQNVVPGRVVFRVDARSVDDARIIAVEDELRAKAAGVAAARGVEIVVELLEVRAAVPMDAALRETVAAAALRYEPRAFALPSGAGHDAMCVARVAPAAMLFVPSIGGRSHVGDERTAPADLELGVEAFASALLAAADAP